VKFAVRGSRFAVRSAVRGSRFAVRGSRFAVRSSQFAVRGSQFCHSERSEEPGGRGGAKNARLRAAQPPRPLATLGV